ncbi:MAG TPA: hypothetical protein EYH50_00695 [Pyrodictium delaneyi]|uniref:Ribonuclease P protein component 2 n=1 Tax=Pyrodictium delaneyi TaxID=1273541 RepID=A0A833E8A8_9CREN|nr:hypothetical protein [Pyrodictium delaneyi]
MQLDAAILAVLAVSFVGYVAWSVHGQRMLEKRVALLERRLDSLAKEMGSILKAAGYALQSSDAEKFLEKLRRRRRRRYIAFIIVYEGEQPPSPQEVERAIVRAAERLTGQLTVALARLQLVYYDPERAAGILRVSHDTKYLVLAALGLVRRIGDSRAVIIPVRTTGTIKRAKRALAIARRRPP